MSLAFSFKELEETAIPSYTHRLAPIRYLFLRRLRVALDLLRRHLPVRAEVLDFGCGAGLMTIALQQHGFISWRCDVRPQVCLPEARSRSELWPARGDYEELSRFSGCVTLDVLEHLPDDELARFCQSFAPGAVLVISGPTENWLYRLGRRVAGFKGDYHQRDVFQIERYLRESGWESGEPERWVFSRWLCPAFVVAIWRQTRACKR
jgi:2-polyprenyl-3-methyl-5-hydroxy-6-metoxy-1,4-benzoquinol methylase